MRQLLAFALLVGVCAAGHAQTGRSNILLIVADDLGYADVGAYGSDIRTPNIDALAREGVLFTQFHASPLCAMTRAMLLSGNNNTVAGLARQGVLPGPVIPGLAGYENELSDRVALLPELLKRAGYRTYMAGKWHLGAEADNSPTAAGFQRSFAMTVGGAASHFSGIGIRPGASQYREDGELVEWPEGAYSTALYTDKLIEFLDADRNSDRPFFVLAAYTSPHWPLQVPDEDLNLYAGRYDSGYDRLREQNFDTLKAAGIVPEGSALPPRNPAVRPFAELTQPEKRREARKMELYAAMVDNLDRHVGRLLDYLRANGLYEDTLIIFMSDNGAAGEDYYNEGPPVLTNYIREHYDDAYERMGMPGNFTAYGPQWAEAGSAPFKLYKGFPTEGGLLSPMIAAGPAVARRAETTNAYVTVMDLMPTFLELAGAAYPKDKTPMLGESALAFLAGGAERVHDESYATTLAVSAGSYSLRSYTRRGDWKLLTFEQPFDERNFALYNLAEDPGETTDLAQVYPDKRAEMLALWRAERRKMLITLPEDL